MGKRYSEREMNRPPSQRKYAKHMRVPEGCVDVWRVNTVSYSGPTMIDSQWFDRDQGMARADDAWHKMMDVIKNKGYKWTNVIHVYVEHKAAMKIGEKFHIVNIPSFTPSTLNDPARHEDPDHKQWLAEYTGLCEEADMGGTECPPDKCCRPGFCKRTDDV
jgi:hypothetical protein